MQLIASRQNPVVRQFRAAADRRDSRILLDGAHLLEEALASGLVLELVAIRDGVSDEIVTSLADRAGRAGARVLGVSDRVLSAISPVRSPSGVVAIAGRPRMDLETALEGAPQLVLMLADVQDPGNVGAIIRAADACGATGVIAGEHTADPFGWKALRGSMGSAFRIPMAIRQDLERAASAARDRGIRILAAVPRGGTPLSECVLTGPAAVLFGGEGGGVPERLVLQADERLTIPMRPHVESLNVAVAAGLVAYEAGRQRQIRRT